MIDYQLIEDEKNYMYARILSFIGSIFLVIGSVITIVVAYNAYKRLLADYEEQMSQHI